MHDQMTESDFNRLGAFIESSYGIKMPPSKRIMLEVRLNKRVRALGMPSIEAYCAFLFSHQGMESELVHMVDAVTTNKTEFFREPQSFDFLAKTALPNLLAGRTERDSMLRLWSAACSTGEEPYTIAIVLEEYRRLHAARMDYLVLATDISSQVLEEARQGIYSESKIEPIPLELRKRYLLRSRDANRALARVHPELRRHIRFERVNLMESLDIRPRMDVIMCRNVIIYFDRETQTRLLKRLCELLAPGGYLIMGHSETLNGMALPLTGVAPMIYRRTS